MPLDHLGSSVSTQAQTACIPAFFVRGPAQHASYQNGLMSACPNSTMNMFADTNVMPNCVGEAITRTPCVTERSKQCISHFVRSHILCSVRHQKVDSLPIDGIDLQKPQVVCEHACLQHTSMQTYMYIRASRISR